jgi:multimeric flavodoxin WrbA
MNILIINGSPRKKGLISQMLGRNILFKQSRGAIRAMREIARYAGFKIVKTIERGGTAMHPELTEKDKQKCRKAFERLYI